MNQQPDTNHSPARNTIEDEVLIRALAQSLQPLTARQLREKLSGPFRISEEKLARLLEERSEAGKLHRYKPSGRTRQPRYWTRGIEEYARQTILQILEQRPHTQAELAKRLKSRIPDLGDERRRQAVAQLVRESAVRQLPPMIGSRSVKLSTRSPDPRDYLEDAIAKIARKLSIGRERVMESIGDLVRPSSHGSQNELSGQLLTRMLQVKLAAAQGGLVPLNELWRSMRKEGWDKAGFDRTVLGLADNYRVTLHRHNFPSALTDEEKSELVADELGNYYVGIALR